MAKLVHVKAHTRRVPTSMQKSGRKYISGTPTTSQGKITARVIKKVGATMSVKGRLRIGIKNTGVGGRLENAAVNRDFSRQLTAATRIIRK